MNHHVLGLTCALLLSACRSEKHADASTSSSAVASPSVAPSATPPRPVGVPIASGPRLPIEAGRGLGPIRFGATAATVERLMEMPCDVRTDTICRYIGRSVEFLLKDGVVAEMRVQRQGRPTEPPPRTYGVFNGLTPEGVAPLMLPAAVAELLGKPDSVEPVKDGGPAGTVEIHHYKGLRVEFDRMPNGSIVVGALVVEPTKSIQLR